MSRYTESACKLCRREGTKLFLKGARCETEKCAVNKRPYPPGQHAEGRRREKKTTFGTQLREKQKVKRIYGVVEKQFRYYYSRANRMRGITGTLLLQLLERRFDNVVYRMGFATSRAQARQLITHGHFILNGHKANIPSIIIRPGDEIEVREKSRKNTFIDESLVSAAAGGKIAGWMDVNADTKRGTFVKIPDREEIPLDVQEQLIVELYSK
jgi:small subunit ribosomal protein S4